MARWRDDFEIEVSARPQSVGRVRSRLLAWLGHRAQIPEPSTGSIALAVSEAVANAARHAYPDGSGTIQVRGELSATRLEVTVSDTGNGFQPHAEAPGTGLGMAIIVRLADDVKLHSDADGTEIRIGFDLAPPSVAARTAPARARTPDARPDSRLQVVPR